jgi:hypothetical protein
MRPRFMLVLALLPLIGIAACGKSSEEVERENAARQAAMQKALADSIAEEQAKDRQMREAAAAQATERIESENAAHEAELARAEAAGPTPEQAQSDRAGALRKYAERLVQTLDDPSSVQFRKMELSPKQNGMCAEFNVKTRSGAYVGFKRVVVIDTRVAVEEPPLRDTLTQFLIFQIAARDSGCFPDVEKIHILP